MSAELLKMADGLVMVANSLRLLARTKESEAVENIVNQKVKTETKNTDKKNTAASEKKEKPVTVEAIRAVLAQKSQEGKSTEIKELLGRYGAVKLSVVKPEDYEALYQEVKVL